MASSPPPSSPASSARGKTTLLKRVLTEAHGQKIAVIENEFGEENIDNEILVQDSQRADHPAEQRLRLLHDPRGPAHHAGRPGREAAQGRARLRPRRDRDHRPGRPRPGGADLLHGRRDRRELPARLDPDAGRRQARRRASSTRARRRAARSASPTRSSSARPTWSTPAAVEALTHRIKHMNPRAPQRQVHFGEVPIAEVFDLRGFNLNAKLEIDPEFLKADDARPRTTTTTTTTTTSTASTATTRTTTPTTTTSSPSSSAPTRPSTRPSWRTSWAPSCRSTARRCCATRACCT